MQDPISRRHFLKSSATAAAIFTLPISISGAFAANPTEQRIHGISAFGDLKYPADFTHFDRLNPDAPKGGRFHFSVPSWLFNQNPQTYNTLNSFVLRGDAPPRMEHCFDTLMVTSTDEPDSFYCHTAAWVELSADRNIYRFGVRREAKFHDGSRLTAEDVAFSYRTLKSEGHPSLSIPLGDLDEAVAVDSETVELRFNGKQSAQAVLTAVEMPIFSKSYYSNQIFDASSMDVPLSSGPYRPGKFEAGRYIEYERVEDYWARDLPTARGRFNFDVLRIDFFTERLASFEAFKKGDITWREEFTSKTWATEYGFPAVEDGRVTKQLFPGENRPKFQAWSLNQRRKQFADRRVRQAINLCFDFKWTNEKIFYGAYNRSQSLFEASDFKATGLPTPEELEILEPLRDQVPQSVFEEPPLQPVSNGSGRDRSLLREASDLLDAAGWKRQGEWRVKDGERLSLEVLIRASAFERVLGGMIENLRFIGIDASLRLVDPAQFGARLDEFDYDMVGMAFSFSATPTAESMRGFFSTESAEKTGTNNFPGINDPVFDILLERLSAVESRKELVNVLRVFDRVLRARLDWIPNWFSANHRVAHWDMFGYPELQPNNQWYPELVWWYDAEKAEQLGKT